jgi:MFS family permease
MVETDATQRPSDAPANTGRIILRAIQGIGGSGIYSLVTVMTPFMVPPAKYPTYIAIISSVFVISSVLGPLLGGAICDHTTWRWVFWLKYVSYCSSYTLFSSC